MAILWIVGIAFFVFLLVGLAIASFGFEQFLSDFERLNQRPCKIHMSPSEYIAKIEQKHLKNGIKVYRSRGGDYYINGSINLSDQTLTKFSLASLAIISHEMGHAKQDESGTNIKKLNKLRKAGRILGRFLLLFLLIGVVFIALYFFDVLTSNIYLYLGIASLILAVCIFLYALYEKFQEIKIEKEASDFAILFMKDYLTSEDLKECEDLLNSARLTYWADFFKAMLGFTFLTKRTKLFR